jgi:hypothetical protein
METDPHRHFIERMHWDDVARRIDGGAIAILPIGAAAKQHGLHLPLNTDRIQAEWLAGKIAEKIDALIWPTLTYGHYPAFVEYAGSSSLSIATFEALVREIAGQILNGGCRKLLVLNTGISTLAGRSRAGTARWCADQAFVDPRGATLSACRSAICRAEPWQPRRRNGNVADAGDGAASGGHDARRSQPCPLAGNTGRIDAVRS